jgi:hypothetical protein
VGGTSRWSGRQPTSKRHGLVLDARREPGRSRPGKPHVTRAVTTSSISNTPPPSLPPPHHPSPTGQFRPPTGVRLYGTQKPSSCGPPLPSKGLASFIRKSPLLLLQQKKTTLTLQSAEGAGRVSNTAACEAWQEGEKRAPPALWCWRRSSSYARRARGNENIGKLSHLLDEAASPPRSTIPKQKKTFRRPGNSYERLTLRTQGDFPCAHVPGLLHGPGRGVAARGPGRRLAYTYQLDDLPDPNTRREDRAAVDEVKPGPVTNSFYARPRSKPPVLDLAVRPSGGSVRLPKRTAFCTWRLPLAGRGAFRCCSTVTDVELFESQHGV